MCRELKFLNKLVPLLIRSIYLLPLCVSCAIIESNIMASTRTILLLFSLVLCLWALNVSDCMATHDEDSFRGDQRVFSRRGLLRLGPANQVMKRFKKGVEFTKEVFEQVQKRSPPPSLHQEAFKRAREIYKRAQKLCPPPPLHKH